MSFGSSVFALCVESNRLNGRVLFLFILFLFIYLLSPPAHPSVFSLSPSLFIQVRELKNRTKQNKASKQANKQTNNNNNNNNNPVFLQVRKQQLEVDMEHNRVVPNRERSPSRLLCGHLAYPAYMLSEYTS